MAQLWGMRVREIAMRLPCDSSTDMLTLLGIELSPLNRRELERELAETKDKLVVQLRQGGSHVEVGQWQTLLRAIEAAQQVFVGDSC